MKFPKEAILFEGIKADRRDACAPGEVYEFAGPSNQKGLVRVVCAFNSKTQMVEGWQNVMFVENLRALTPLAEEVLKNPPRQIAQSVTPTSVDVVFDD